MTQITLNIEDGAIVPHLKKILEAIKGVTIVSSEPHEASGLDEALADKSAGRTTTYQDTDELFQALGI